jgi:hypothetical protein
MPVVVGAGVVVVDELGAASDGHCAKRRADG